MKKALLISVSVLCLILSSNCLAALIRCYSAGKIIFNGHGSNPGYLPDGYLVFRDKAKHYLFVSGDCIVRLEKGDKA